MQSAAREGDEAALAASQLASHAATKQLDGQITKIMSTPSRKNISLPSSGKSVISIRASRPIRGDVRTSRTLRRDAVDAGDGERRMPERADGEVVWS
jgi:hypothetical protein